MPSKSHTADWQIGYAHGLGLLIEPGQRMQKAGQTLIFGQAVRRGRHVIKLSTLHRRLISPHFPYLHDLEVDRNVDEQHAEEFNSSHIIVVKNYSFAPSVTDECIPRGVLGDKQKIMALAPCYSTRTARRGCKKS